MGEPTKSAMDQIIIVPTVHVKTDYLWYCVATVCTCKYCTQNIALAKKKPASCIPHNINVIYLEKGDAKHQVMEQTNG